MRLLVTFLIRLISALADQKSEISKESDQWINGDFEEEIQRSRTAMFLYLEDLLFQWIECV